MKTWQGRIDAQSDPLFESFTSSIGQDRRLAPYDVTVSQAHARGLAKAEVITDGEAEDLVRALEEIGEEIERGDMQWRDELEDVHTHVENRLRENLGPLADKLHTGRSRNDQIAADLRLYVKDRTRDTMAALLDAQDALLTLSERYDSALMPGYTHLQQAQPIMIAQALLSYVTMLGRDWERFWDGLGRTDLSPLGSGALAGTSFPLDREQLASECGFSGVTQNSIDSVGDRDFLVEFVAAAAICMTHLSRFSEDLILWSSVEFGFVRLPDAFASGSSMLPQKKNPDVAELIRGKAALVIGDVAGSLSLIKGLPGGYNRDLQEDKTPLYHAVDSLLPSLRILAAMIPELRFDVVRTEAAISSFAVATDIADHLVQRGLPFRDAHAVVGRLVARCLEEGRDLGDLTDSDLTAASPLLAEMPLPTPATSVARKRTSGGTGRDSVAAQIAAARQQARERRAELGMGATA